MIKSISYLVRHLVKHFPSYRDTSSVFSCASCYISRTKEGAFRIKRSLAIPIARAWRIAPTLPLYCSIIRERKAIVSPANYHWNRGCSARCPLCVLETKKKKIAVDAHYICIDADKGAAKYFAEIRAAAHLRAQKLGESNTAFDFSFSRRSILATL